jgi:hypothetical protein
MKYLILFCLVSTQAFAGDALLNFNKQLMENFDKDMKTNNDLSVRKNRGPVRGPASVAPEIIEEEKKIDKTVRQTGHRAW